MNRDRIREMRAMRGDADERSDEDDGRLDIDQIGFADAEITTAVDIIPWLATKRAAMAAHASQVGEDSWFLSLPPEVFAGAFGTEWFRRVIPHFDGDPVTDREGWILE